MKPQGTQISTLSSTEVPQHIAIIMDGNGRWARSRGLPRLEGHKNGALSVRAIATEARKIGVRYLTLFSFSSENWGRTAEEVDGLMSLFSQYLVSEKETLRKNDIRLRAIGDLSRFDSKLQTLLFEDLEETATNSGLDLILALSYSGREEILSACRSLM